MGKGKKKLALCTTEKIELDLTSCWMDNEADTRHGCKKPSIKTVAITKSTDMKITNRIGDFFRNYNIIAYGFNNGSLNIDVVFLLNGYTCLCRNDTITDKAANITISLISEQKPKGADAGAGRS